MSDRRDDNPTRPGEEWRRDLAASMRRVNEQLAEKKWPAFDPEMKRVGEQIARGVAHEALSRVSEVLERAEERRLGKIERKLQRRQERIDRKRAHRTARYRERMLSTTIGGGVASIIMALGFAAAAALTPYLWLAVFAVLFTLRGTRVLEFQWRERHPRKVAPLPAPKDERDTRIDEVCDRLLAALKDAPESVRDFLSTPEQTVESLRKTSHDLLKRERALRELANPAEVDRLNRERVTLEVRIAGESDDVVRARLQGALAALDNQREQHAEVLKSANRLDAERTRLGYTLDGLYAQVMRVRTADAGTEDVVQAGLRQSLDQLRAEMSALADAVEQVGTPPPAMDAPSGDAPLGQRGRVRT